MKIAIIPARGGSKRIKRKNVKSFGKRPMIAWAIDVAKKSQCFDRVIVSTDDEEISKVSLNSGAEVPFLRPKKLSGDHSTTLDVIKHAVDWYTASGVKLSYVCCLYPTTPFLTAADLQEGLKLLIQNKATFSFAAARYSHPIQRAMKMDPSNLCKLVDEKSASMRSQDLEQMYYDVGQFYWARCSDWSSENQILGNNSCAVIIPQYRAIDFDTEEDWERAEWLFRSIKGREEA